jgi:hypothetical protein
MPNLNALTRIPFFKEPVFLRYDGMSLAEPMEEITKALKRHQIS